MASKLEFTPGNAAIGGGNAAEEVAGSIWFPDDGNGHDCGWTNYVPTVLRTQDPVILRMTFFSMAAIGNAVLRFGYISTSPGDVLPIGYDGSIDVDVTTTQVNKLVAVDIDISSWIQSDKTLLFIYMERDSSRVGDNLAGSLHFLNGITL